MELLDSAAAEFDALQTVIRALSPLPEEARGRIFYSAGSFLKIHSSASGMTRSTYEPTGSSARTNGPSAFSEDRSISPKQFLLEKKPLSMVERIACLAYYLTHYRDTPHFRNVDISAINTEAAQTRIANPARDIGNAQSTGYVVPAGRGARQLSAAGEAFVLALPDRDAAKAAMSKAKPRRKIRKTRSSAANSDSEAAE